MSRYPLTLIAAVARNGVIGAGGRMPWHLPGDLAEFRRLTSGHPLLMGRATFEAIGRPLPGRPSIVVSSRTGFTPAGVTVAEGLETALAEADREADRLGAKTIMVIGGGQIYAATIDRAGALLITCVDLAPEGDTLFPAIDPAHWRKIEDRPASPAPGDSASYRFTRWKRQHRATATATGNEGTGSSPMPNTFHT